MHDAQIALQDDTAPAAADASHEAGKSNLVLRNDTILGVCEAIGQDFGFNANWLRIALALGLFWNAAFVIGGYLAVGIVVAASRLIFPDVRAAAAAQPVEAVEPANTNEEALQIAA